MASLIFQDPDAIEIVRFVPQSFDREIAAIGGNPVGWIDSAYWGKIKRAKYCCTMFDGQLELRAENISKARVALLRRLADWYDSAGELHSDIARLIRLQADALS